MQRRSSGQHGRNFRLNEVNGCHRRIIMKATKSFYLSSAPNGRQTALPLGTGCGVEIVGSLHVAPISGELPPRRDSAPEPSFRIHNSSLSRAILGMLIPDCGAAGCNTPDVRFCRNVLAIARIFRVRRCSRGRSSLGVLPAGSRDTLNPLRASRMKAALFPKAPPEFVCQ